MKRALLLASGGLDSTTVGYLLNDVGVSVVPVFIDYSQHCVELEWARVNEVLPSGFLPPERIDISTVFNGSKSRMIDEANLWTEEITADDLYIPYRTLLFISVAAARAQTLGITDVYTGFINSNHAKEIDCSSSYLNSIDGMTETIGDVRVHSPFRNNSKTEVMEKALELGVPVGRTFSCQVFSDFPCGVCPNCVDRLNAVNQVSD